MILRSEVSHFIVFSQSPAVERGNSRKLSVIFPKRGTNNDQ